MEASCKWLPASGAFRLPAPRRASATRARTREVSTSHNSPRSVSCVNFFSAKIKRKVRTHLCRLSWRNSKEPRQLIEALAQRDQQARAHPMAGVEIQRHDLVSADAFHDR